MLIPSIDLQDGRVVQLQQGERLVVASDDLDGWLTRFARFPLIQVIDLDAAKGRGSNRDLVRTITSARACQVGGGIRTPADAAAILANGATAVIVGSALFSKDGVRVDVAETLAQSVGRDRFIAAVDARKARIAVDGWQTTTSIGVEEAMAALEPFAGGFLATLIDGEGMMGGIDMMAVTDLRRATSRRLIAAGGIRSHAEIKALDDIGVDAVVGMAIYTGVMQLDEA
jgi:phosphoribosylformimino-5-aminoimidazole carboxamide ribotide isomerase